ncbi:MAG: substrate-binding domain-containing protein, partial [Gemmataceae bacterium]|nr:substrate-binding domain-containing protein [Gemmataceae bacterium]
MKTLHLLAFASLVMAGCSGGTKTGGGDGDKPTVAFVTNNPDPWWNMAEAGGAAAAAKAKVELVFRKPADGTPAAQKEEVENAIGQGVKAVAVSVIDPRNQKAFLDQIAGKVPLLAVDNDAPKSERAAYIGTDNYAAGRAVGKLAKEALGEKGGTVAIFVGRLDSLNARQRRQGVIDELFDRPALKDPNEFTDSPDGEAKGKYKLHEATLTDQPQGRAKAVENAENFVNNLPEGNVCLVGLWAYNPPACLAAASKVKDEAKRARISIVGFDEDPTTL